MVQVNSRSFSKTVSQPFYTHTHTVLTEVCLSFMTYHRACTETAKYHVTGQQSHVVAKQQGGIGSTFMLTKECVLYLANVVP